MHPSNRPTENLDRIFTYHKPVKDQASRYERIRNAARVFTEVVIDCTPECADKTAAVRKIREAVMTANASIALETA